jgi:hypothetical protein
MPTSSIGLSREHTVVHHRALTAPMLMRLGIFTAPRGPRYRVITILAAVEAMLDIFAKWSEKICAWAAAATPES